MDAGELVPDEIIVAMMAEETAKCSGGFILDGFPRTTVQAEEFHRLMAESGNDIDLVLNLKIDDETVKSRLTGRRSCPECGAVYHVDNLPPKVDNLCDNDGEKLVQRADDKPHVVENRLRTYHRQTMPVLDYYRGQGQVYDIDANAEPEEVTSRIMERLDALAGSAAEGSAGG
jgi:adenylate kinase